MTNDQARGNLPSSHILAGLVRHFTGKPVIGLLVRTTGVDTKFKRSGSVATQSRIKNQDTICLPLGKERTIIIFSRHEIWSKRLAPGDQQFGLKHTLLLKSTSLGT